ncbi:MAG: TerB family tellurite resistance protein [Planctomycetota bacterium]
MTEGSALQHQGLRFVGGLALLALGGSGVLLRLMRLPAGLWPLSVLVAFVGFRVALAAAAPMARLVALQRRAHTAWSDAARNTFVRASLPRRIYYLLASVAAADGPMSAAERQAIRHFVLERFADPVQAADLRDWEAQPFPVDDRTGLAARIAMGLEQPELDSLFCWCCFVAFADGRYNDAENDALRQVAAGLGLGAARARMLFQLARAQQLRGERAGDGRSNGRNDDGRRGGRSGSGPATAPPPADARRRALDELGLPVDATPAQIRKRHRELVRKFHPDAQPHLGPVAQREATERFTAIQRAYETLTADGGAA